MIEIREEHIEECAKLYVSVFNAAPWNDKWTIETAKKRLEEIFVAPNFVGMVHKDEDGKIVGAIFGNYEQFYDGLHYNLKEMFVDTQVQGTNIGSCLLQHLEARLKELGISVIMLFTSKGNRTSKFYWKNNFQEWTSMTLMGKEIKK